MTVAVGSDSLVSPDAAWIERLRAQLAGQLITSDSVEFDAARAVRDIMLERRPLAIVRPATAEDVAEVVRVARAYDLPLAIRSGGHSIARYGTIDGAIVIDLSDMKRIDVNPLTRTASVQAGNTSGDLAGPAAVHGLALSTGDTASVGFGGLTTGGGIGYMVRKYGLTIDNLLAAQVVTADGVIVTASATEHPELFWAIRGGGGNFGIITEFTFRLAPVPQILGGLLMLPATREVIRAYLEYAVAAPDDLTTLADVMLAPPFPFVPQEYVGQPVLSILVCWTGSEEEGERVLAPLRALATPVADLVSPIPYPDIYNFTEHLTHPFGWSIRSMFANELSDATLDAALDALRDTTSPFNLFHLRPLGGAMFRVSPGATAFAHRHQRYFVAVIGVWLDPNEDESLHQGWVKSLWQTIRHEADGVYVNFLEQEGEDRIHDAYPPATYARLAEVKRRYDPDNVFRFNQNINPAG